MSRMGLVDASGRKITPAEVARVRARAMLNVSEGRDRGPEHWGAPWAYDAQAWHGQDFGEWFPSIRSPDAEINVDRDRSVGRVRDLERNDGWASGALDTITDQAVGASFFPRPTPNWRALTRLDPRLDGDWATEFGQAAEAEYNVWANDPGRWCDGARALTMAQIMRLAFLHKIRDGDAAAILLWDEGSVSPGAARYATRVQLIDPDRLSNPYEMLDTDHMRGGVETDLLGGPVAYWFRRAEPNDWFEASASMIWDRFERETPWGRPIVVHDFDRRRAGQHRGTPVLLPVVPRFKMLSRYDQVSLQRAVLQSLIGIFVKSPYDTDMVRQAMETEGQDLGAYQGMREAFGDSNPPMMMGGIRVPKLFPGESIEAVKSDNSLSEFEAFEHAVLRSIAAVTGASAEDVTRDYSRVNYSSARAAMLVAWKTLLRRRQDFGTGFASPVYTAFLEEAVDRGRVPLPAGAPDFAEWRSAYASCRWIGPGRGWIDPVKERQGEVLGMDAGFSTLESVVAELSGADWRDVLQQRAAEVAEFARLGLKLPDWAAGGAEADAALDERKPKPA
jgi:lambda family phage portal protein